VCNIKPVFISDKDLFRRLTTAKTLRDLIEVRQIVETEAASLAAERATDEDLKTMLSDVEALAERIEIGGSIPEDLDFHISVLKATQNEVLIQLSSVIIDFYRLHDQPPNELDVPQHREIFEAIHAKDPARARNAMRKHLSFTSNHLFGLIDLGDSDHEQK